jgi:cyclopropane-fatty-acyl-phospholipid synthase
MVAARRGGRTGIADRTAALSSGPSTEYIEVVTAIDPVRTLEQRYRRYFSSRSPVPFALRTADSTHTFGTGEPAFTITVADPRGARALASLDQLRVAVAYLRGWLDLDGDLISALSIREFFADVHPVASLARLGATLLPGGMDRDRRDIAAHYDRDPEFFLTFMDHRHRCYTQGIFASDDEPLEDAMTRKMRLALEAIDVRPGDRVLEVGGGWGAFCEYAGARGVEVTTLTLSVESERYLNELVRAQNLPVRVVRQHLLHYAPGERYAAIVNMGTTEHLPNYRRTLRRYAELLRPGGTVYLDALAMRARNDVSSFMRRYIYPGASSPLVLHEYLREVARSPFLLRNVIDERHNYHLTCKAWAERFDAAREEVIRRWGEPLYRRFRLFLWGSAAGFATGEVQAYRWVMTLPGS